jgi:hypothetical protein
VVFVAVDVTSDDVVVLLVVACAANAGYANRTEAMTSIATVPVSAFVFVCIFLQGILGFGVIIMGRNARARPRVHKVKMR